jgi:hypothetical protein
MPVPRRDFMKILGISIGSMLLTRCQRTADPEPTLTFVTCYMVEPYTPNPNTPTPADLSARSRLRLCWLRFGELEAKTRDGTNTDDGGGDPLGTRMIKEHRTILFELTAAGEITEPVALLIQEAYGAAVYHVWRSNAPITCYEPMIVDYAPSSAGNLVHQSEVLSRISGGSTVNPETIEKARAALEHDLAFYALSDSDMQALYDQLLEEYRDPGGSIPTFEDVKLTLTPDAQAAAQFLLDVLTGAD